MPGVKFKQELAIFRSLTIGNVCVKGCIVIEPPEDGVNVSPLNERRLFSRVVFRQFYDRKSVQLTVEHHFYNIREYGYFIKQRCHFIIHFPGVIYQFKG